jgi:hypothetical protein
MNSIGTAFALVTTLCFVLAVPVQAFDEIELQNSVSSAKLNIRWERIDREIGSTVLTPNGGFVLYSNSTELVCVDCRNGDTCWRRSSARPHKQLSMSATPDAIVVFDIDSDRFETYSIDDGHLRDETTIESAQLHQVIANGDFIYWTDENRIGRFNLTTRESLQLFDYLDDANSHINKSSPAKLSLLCVSDSKLFFAARNRLCILDIVTNEFRMTDERLIVERMLQRNTEQFLLYMNDGRSIRGVTDIGESKWIADCSKLEFERGLILNDGRSLVYTVQSAVPSPAFIELLDLNSKSAKRFGCGVLIQRLLSTNDDMSFVSQSPARITMWDLVAIDDKLPSKSK